MGRTERPRGNSNCCEALSGLSIVAIDFNTVSPPQDVCGMATQLCSHMIMEALVLLAFNLGLLPD